MGRPSFRACQSDRSARRRRDNILARHQNSQRRLEPTGQLLPRPATAAGNTLGVRSQRRTRTKQSFESDQRSHGGRALVPTGLMGTASRKPIQLSRGRAATPPMDLVYEEVWKAYGSSNLPLAYVLVQLGEQLVLVRTRDQRRRTKRSFVFRPSSCVMANRNELQPSCTKIWFFLGAPDFTVLWCPLAQKQHWWYG